MDTPPRGGGGVSQNKRKIRILGGHKRKKCAAGGGEIFEISGLKALENPFKIAFQSAKNRKIFACGGLIMIGKIAFQSG